MNNKINKKLIIILKIIILLFLLIYTFLSIKNSLDYSLNIYSNNTENNFYDTYDEKLHNEMALYNDIYTKYKNQNQSDLYKNPYIPSGFSYLEGTWDTGFVVEDNNKNQFVWIPCSLEKNKNTIILNKYDFFFNSFIEKNECVETYESILDFLSSVFENGGFYIGRYETGILNELPVIQKDVPAYTNISYDTALSLSKSIYPNNDNFTCTLINSYAFDTAYSWIKSTNSLQNEISRNEYTTGYLSYNNIFDLVDTLWEWTTESHYESMIARGISKTSNIMNSSLGNRFALSSDTLIDNVGFRVIIYK